jgi:hypothetical protein
MSSAHSHARLSNYVRGQEETVVLNDEEVCANRTQIPWLFQFGTAPGSRRHSFQYTTNVITMTK